MEIPCLSFSASVTDGELVSVNHIIIVIIITMTKLGFFIYRTWCGSGVDRGSFGVPL